MKKLSADIVVVAAGACGLAASVAAAELGAKVIAFEKGATTGGTGNMGMGPFAVESRHQRRKQLGPTRDEAFKIFMDYTHWRADARLVRAYIDKSADTIHWLEKQGVEFVEPATYFAGGNFTWHLVKPTTGQPGPMSSGTMMRILTEKAKSLGVEFMLQTPVQKILKSGGRITGVLAEDRNGDTIQVDANAVIVATGGFGDNPEWIKKYTGFDFGKDLFSFRIPGLAGDGIRMAWEAGAAPTEMRMELTYNLPAEIEPALSCAFRQPHLVVNLQGERFMDEGVLPNTTFSGNAISLQKDRCAFAVFDENTKKHMETKGFDYINSVFPFPKIENFDSSLTNAFDRGAKVLFVADTLDELAAKTGIDPEGLKKTVAEYNGFCAKGHDDLFNKNYRSLRPVNAPKFYAGKLYPSGYGTVGGIKINHKAEAIDKTWKPVPGLYAGGNDACSIYGDSYVFILPGNSMGFALNTGRIAAESAAEYIKMLG